MTPKDSERIIALLPMKAHSSRVTRKNFRDFCGKPLFRWTLDTLLDVPEIDQVVINTDARNILEENGLMPSERILIRDRKREICGDEVSMNVVLSDDIANVHASIYLMTHTTNPLIRSSTIIECLASFKSAKNAGKADSLFTVNKLQTRLYDSSAMAINHEPMNLIPTQDLEPWFEENSNLYLFTRESFSATKARIGLKPMMYHMDRTESIDIDTQEDWDLASFACAYNQK